MSRLTLFGLSVLLIGTFPSSSSRISNAGAQEQVRSLSVGMDAAGKLTQWGTAENNFTIRSKILKSTGTTNITITPATPINVAERAINDLLQAGARVELSGAYCLFNGHLFYSWNETISPPILDLGGNRLHKLAESKARPSARPIQSYFLYISEAGQIIGYQRIMGPQISEVEKELMKTRVLAPSRRGSSPVPVRWTIAI
jgi:hypothetical protein